MIDELKTGGAQTHLLTILRYMCAAYDAEHQVVSLFNDGPVGDELREMGIETEVLGLDFSSGTGSILKGFVRLQDLIAASHPEVVEAHLSWSRLLALPAAWRVGVVRRIGFEQGDLYMNSPLMRSANFLGQLFAHRIVVCSSALADWAHRTHGFQRSRMTVLHNCVDTARFKPAPGTLPRGDIRTLAVATRFCAIGTLGSGVDKRMDIAIRAVAEARAHGSDVGLLICGDGEKRPILEDLARSLGLGDYILFLGMRRDIPSILAQSQGFCHASPFEPLGIVCLEAMACGLPVLVPASGGIQETVVDRVTGLLYPALDYEALSRLMIAVHQDPRWGEDLGAAARRHVEERFSVTSYASKLWELYRQSEPGGSQAA